MENHYGTTVLDLHTPENNLIESEFFGGSGGAGGCGGSGGCGGGGGCSGGSGGGNAIDTSLQD